MLILSDSIVHNLDRFRPLFSKRMWQWATVQMVGAILTPGEPTERQDDDLLPGEDEDGEPDDAAQAGAAEPPWLPGQEALQQPLWEEMAAKESASGDGLYAQAEEEVRQAGRASVSFLQRRLRIGYSRAARLIDELESNGVIGPDLGGSRGREVLEGDGDQGVGDGG